MKYHSVVLSAMSNPRRLAILKMLEAGEMSVNAMADALALSQSALSQHLSKLRLAKLVKTRRDAQTIYYAIGSPYVAAILSALKECEAGQAAQLSAATLTHRDRERKMV